MSDAAQPTDPRTLGERLITAARLAAAEHVRQELMGLERRRQPRKVVPVAHLVAPPSNAPPPAVVGAPVRVTAAVRRRPPEPNLREAA